MSTIAQEILAIATEHGYTGTAQATIAGAINALADTLAGEDATDGSTIAGAVKALAPYVGAEPSGTITITENGTDIDVASYAKADVSVSGGASFGALQYSPLVASAAPSVGDTISPSAMMNVKSLGLDAQSQFMESFTPAFYIAEGVYVTGVYEIADGGEDTVDAYVCTLTIDGYTATIATVTPWDGHVDVQSVGDLTFAFTMPDLGGLDPTTHAPSAMLIFHVYKAD